MAKAKFSMKISMKWAWWFWPAIYVYKWTCFICGIEPSMEDVYRAANKAVTVYIDGKPAMRGIFKDDHPAGGKANH